MATAATVTPSPIRSHRVGEVLIELSAISVQLSASFCIKLKADSGWPTSY
jgi:hypothetical protein